MEVRNGRGERMMNEQKEFINNIMKLIIKSLSSIK